MIRQRLEILEETWKLLEGTFRAWFFPKVFYKNKTFPKEETIMKKSLVLAMAMALGVTASAYAANPFSDVPAGHWAYDSVAKLAAAGVVDGYTDGAFAGDKLITRYEMAQIVAKAMAKGADCDKLAAEFADELDTLGVRVAKLEKGADAVKITGETRLRYWNFDGNTQTNGDKTALRTRIWIKGQVNDDWSATAMLENTQTFNTTSKGIYQGDKGEEDTSFQRAYVNGKIGGLIVQAGRYSFCDFLGGLVYDDRVDGVQLSYGKDVKVTAAIAKASDKTTANNGDDMAYVEAATKLGMVDAKAAWYKVENTMQSGIDAEVYAVQAGLPLAKDLKFAATYFFNETEDYGTGLMDDGYVLALNYKGAKAAKPGSWGLWAKYYDQPWGTFVAPTFEADDAKADADFFVDMLGGFKGYGVGADYAIAKNIVAQVKYYDLEAQEGENDRQVLYSQVNFAF